MPISGQDPEMVIKKVNKAKAAILKMGHEPISPTDLPHEHDRSWNAYMHEDINALLNCDGIFLCNGWEKSRGCRLEFMIANECGKLILLPN